MPPKFSRGDRIRYGQYKGTIDAVERDQTLRGSVIYCVTCDSGGKHAVCEFQAKEISPLEQLAECAEAVNDDDA